MRQGSRYLWGTALAVAAVAIAGASPAAAAGGCSKRGATRVASSSQAVVLRSHGVYYGCSFDRGKLHKLQGQTDNTTVIAHTVTVKRSNGAYATKYHRGAGTINL